MTALDQIPVIVSELRDGFRGSASCANIESRETQLRRMRTMLIEREDRFLDALAADFGKPRAEAWLTEIGFTINDVNHTLAHLPCG